MNNQPIIDTPTSKETLFSIGESFYALETLLTETQGEITDDIDQWLSEYKAKESDKVDSFCFLIQKFSEISEEAQRLADRAIGYRNKVSQLKNRLKTYLEIRGQQKIETSRFTVTVCGNGGQLPIRLHEGVTVDDLPETYVRQYREPDFSSLREALNNGNDKASRFAELLPRGTHLRIK